MVNRNVWMAGIGVLSLAACASDGGVEDIDPITGGDGTVAPQRNLLMSDLSANSGGNGRAIAEVFQLSTTAFRAAPDPAGNADPNGQAPFGLVRGSNATEAIGAGNTMTFTPGTNQFVFDISTAAGDIQRTFNHVLLEDPVETPGILNSRYGKLFFSNANGIADAIDLGVGPGASYLDYAAALTAIQESDSMAYAAIIAVADQIIGADQFIYAYTFAGGEGYLETTNMNGAPRTDTVGIGSIYEFYDTGEEQGAHFVFGHRTPLDEMPTTGTATFEGKVVGSVLTNNSIRSLTGGSDLNVDFAAGLIDVTLTTIIREGGGQTGGTTFIPYKNVSGRGAISDTTFSGTLSEINGTATGDFEGAFFGPVANEAGGTFEFGNGSGYVSGAFTAAQPANLEDAN